MNKRLLTTLAMVIALEGCDTPNSPPVIASRASGAKERVGPRPDQIVRVAPLRFDEIASHRPGTLQQREGEILAAIANEIPQPKIRAMVLRDLQDSSKTIGVYSDPIVSKQIADLYRLRLLERAAQNLAASRTQAQTHPIRVTLAFTGQSLGSSRAIVVRPPSGSGYSVILLPRDATPGSLALAFRALWEIRNTEGDLVPSERRVSVLGTDFKLAPDRMQTYDGYLSSLRSAPGRDVRGVYLAAAFDVTLGHLRNATATGDAP